MLAFTMLIEGFSGCLPGTNETVNASASTNSMYMAKLQGTYLNENQVKREYTSISQVTSGIVGGATYQLSCDYYVAEGGAYGYGAIADIWSAGSAQGSCRNQLQNDQEGHVTVTIATSVTDSWIGIGFQAEPGAVVYIWNISLKKEGSDAEVLRYTGFNEVDHGVSYAGTWRGWTIAGTTIWDRATSENMEASYGQQVIPYDATILPSFNPSYMAKLDGDYVNEEGQVQSNIDVMQSVVPTAGKTYVFSCNYYDRSLSGGAYLLAWTNATEPNQNGADANGRYSVKTTAGIEGSLELTYTATENDTRHLTVALEAADATSECYVWNLRLTEQGSDKNLLHNANFQQESGTWIGWTIKDTSVGTVSDSKSVESAYGQKIVTGGRELIEALKIDDASHKTYQDPNQNFSFENLNQYKDLDEGRQGMERYMAKLNGTYVDENQTTQIWKRVSQILSGLEENTTYTFQFDYFVESSDWTYDCNLLPVLWNTKQVQETLEAGSKGTAKLTYTTGKGETWLGIGFDCQPNATAYIRNVSVKAEDSDTNLLCNGDFAEESGTWIGWLINGETIVSVEESKDKTMKYGHSILSYEEKLFSDDLADWSMQMKLEDSLTLVYNTDLKMKVVEGTIPTMRFEMRDKNLVTSLGTIDGMQNADGTYSFHFEVLPQWLGNQIAATLTVQTSSGAKIQTKDYSVKDYCTTILKDSRSSVATKNLVADLLRYGAQTRVSFGEEDVITSDLKTLIDGYGSTSLLSDITGYVASPIEGTQSEEVRWKSGRLVLDEKVTIRLIFEAQDLTNLAVKVNGGEYTIAVIGSGVYYVDVPISAVDYATIVTAQFYKDSTPIGATLKYSVYTYLYRMQNSLNAELLTSIYRYGQSAKAYQDLMDAGTTDKLEYAGGYAFFSEGNCADRMNGQNGGADKEATVLRETIMNSSNTVPTGNGTIYYISAENGNDANDGKSKETAWAGLGGYARHVSSIAAGDTVLFERGGIYRGDNIGLKSGVTYGSYGSGAKPAIYGSSENYIGAGKWVGTAYSNVWKCSNTFSRDIGTIVFNHGEAVGIKKIGNSDYLNTNVSELKHNFEFYQDSATGQLYLYLERNPSDIFYDIEICQKANILKADAGCTGVTIDNLSVKYGGGHAIRFDSNASNITITNCEIAFVGGSIQSGTTRYGNGIEFWNGCSDIKVQSNWIYQIYDAGITHQGGTDSEGGYTQQRITLKNNLLEYCSYTLEFYVGNPDTDAMKDITYEDNIIRFAGYGWGMVRPDSFAVAAINAWGQQGKYSIENFKVQNNIFDVSNNALIVQYHAEKLDITYDRNTYYQKVPGNVAIWTNRTMLGANDQDTMRNSVLNIEANPKLVSFIEN